jgi:hypothetical protein
VRLEACHPREFGVGYPQRILAGKGVSTMGNRDRPKKEQKKPKQPPKPGKIA